MADDAVPDPARDAGRRAAVATALVLVLAALTGELRAPAPVLSSAVWLGLVALAAVGLAALIATTGVAALVADRSLRTGALVPIALVTFLVAGPRFRLIVMMLWILVGLLTLAVVIAAVFSTEPDHRDRVAALIAVVVVPIGGWFGAGLVQEGRLAIHADRYRAEAEALLARPVSEYTEYPSDLDEPFLAGRELTGVGEPLDPVDVAWLWDPGEDGPASSWGVLYAPDGGPVVRRQPGGVARHCEAAAVDDFYWCSFV